MDIVKLATDSGFDELSVVENQYMFLQFAQAVLRIDNSFYNEVIDELVICGIYSKEHDSSPRKAIQDIIKWHRDVALDPAVSSDAQALLKKERDECLKSVIEVLTSRHVECYNEYHNFQGA